MTHKRKRPETPWIERAKYDVAHPKERTERLIKEVAEIRKKKEDEK